MKKILLFICSLAFFSTAQCQIVFYESFDHIPGDTSGGAGTFVFPNGWLLANVDTLTPNTGVSFVNNAWVRNSDYLNNNSDSAAFSTSWYSPAGQADDWMVTPAIGPLPAGTVLSWRGIAYNAFYADGYEVRIMTTTPVGGTGTIGNLLDSSVVLLTDSAENDTWTTHHISLNAYAGQTVYIAFRNHSTDKDLLLIDDVKLEGIQDDAKLVMLDTVTEYSILPKNQLYTIPTQATVVNNGSNTLSNVALKLNVYNGSQTQIFSNTGTTTAVMLPGDTLHLSAGNYTFPQLSDTYILEYVVTHSGVDNNTANDTLYDEMIIDDSTFARDQGPIPIGLGLSQGSSGYIGQQFTLTSPAYLSSITFYTHAGFQGHKAACVLWDMAAGVPNNIIAGTDTMTYTDSMATTGFFTMPLSGGALSLQPGTYTVTAVQFDTTIAVGQSVSKFTFGTNWLNFSSSPLGSWVNVESFGTSFQRTCVLRLNLTPDCAAFTTAINTTNATCNTCTDGSATAIPSGIGPYTFIWSNGATTQSITGLSPGVYSVTVTGGGLCTASSTDTVSFTNGLAAINISSAIVVYPNPSNGIFNVVIPDGFGEQIQLEILNAVGQIVLSKKENGKGVKSFGNSEIASGKYTLRLISEKYSISKELTIIR